MYSDLDDYTDFYRNDTFHVIYNGNGNTAGSAPVDANTYYNGDTVTVPGAGSLVRTGYTFSSWNTADDGSGTEYDPLDTFLMGAGNVTLYAQWTGIPYTVTYNGNGNLSGTTPVDGNTYILGDNVTVLWNTGGIARTGYIFSGWNTASDGSGTYYDTGETFTIGAGNVTLYAQWASQFLEDWESGTDGWISDGGDTWGLDGTEYVSNSNSLLIRAAPNWDYLDGLHYEFATGIQPAYISFYIQKSANENLPQINIGGNTTSIEGGGIYFYWDDSYGNWTGNYNVMCVTDNTGTPYMSGEFTEEAFYFVEFRNINFITQTFDFHVDTVAVALDVHFHSPAASFTRMYISSGWYGSYTYIDDIVMY